MTEIDKMTTPSHLRHKPEDHSDRHIKMETPERVNPPPWRRQRRAAASGGSDDEELSRESPVPSRGPPPNLIISTTSSLDDSDHPVKPRRRLFGRQRANTDGTDYIEKEKKNGIDRIKKKLGKLRRNRAESSDSVERGVRKCVSFDAPSRDYLRHSDHSHMRSTSGDSSIAPPVNVQFSLDCVGAGSIQLSGFTAGSSHMSASIDGLDSASFHTPGERARYSVYHGSRGTKRRFRVRPYHCFPEAVYMTEEEIYKDSTQPSQNFEYLQSYLAPSSRLGLDNDFSPVVKDMWGSPHDDGRIGALRMEVLGAISLARQKPDVAVYIVCGDTPFVTDALTGYRSPMWPNQSKRAAVFPVHHAYAKVFVGVFDVRARKNKENDVYCGRVVIDIASLRPDTEYDITYPLRASSFIYDRKPRGVIRLRFSLHWFNERAAVFSYFRSPKSLVRSCPLVDGQPAIPCADPKTFRNVAITVHGHDLPGKYSRNAFRATMREFNLYQQNLRQMIKLLIVDAVFYEKPLVSLYLFLGGMHAIVTNAIWLVPPYFVGYLLILFLQNHQHYVEASEYNLGYKPLTLWEIAAGFFLHYHAQEPSFDPILLQKRTKRRRTKSKAAQKLKRLDSDVGSEPENDKDIEIYPLDHREFPFADRDTYAKLAVEDALAPSAKSSRRGSTTRLHGRLSVYYTTAAPIPMDGGANGGDEEEEDSDEDSDMDRDDETIMSESGMGDTIYGDLDDNDLEMDMEHGVVQDNALASTSLFQTGEASARRRLRVGPPQNSDVRGNTKIPPQVHLQRFERILHKLTRGLAVEHVHPAADWGAPASSTSQSEPGTQSPAATTKKKPVMDEFDKLLGLQFKSANPVQRIAASFLGPLMRIFRIFLFVVRISFNISTWRDPYLSFWVFLALCCACVFLIMFPWRAFFAIVTAAAVGPQNLGVRLYLEKKQRDKKRKEEEGATAAVASGKAVDGYGYERAEPTVAKQQGNEEKKDSVQSLPEKAEASSSFFGRSFWSKRGDIVEEDELEPAVEERPAFGQPSTGRKVQPRAVVIPYSRFKKDRFYDWPPDPTVSRATPLAPLLEDYAVGFGDEPAPECISSAPSPDRPGMRRRGRPTTTDRDSSGFSSDES